MDEHGFSERDKQAIGLRLRAYPGWCVEYRMADGVEYARVSPADPSPGEPGWTVPELTLARRDGLTGFAARWADGSEFCSALLASLSGALCLIVQSIEDAMGAGAGSEEDGAAEPVR